MKLRKKKKSAARDSRTAASAADSVTPASAWVPVGSASEIVEDLGASAVTANEPPDDTDVADRVEIAEVMYKSAAERAEIAEVMYRAALTRGEIAEARELATAERVAAVEAMENAAAERVAAVEAMENAAAERVVAMELAAAERVAAVEAMENAAAERVAAAAAMDSAAAERAAALAAREQAAAERAAALAAREKAVAERDSIATSRDRAAAERDTIANSRDRAAVERDSILNSRLSPGRTVSPGEDGDAELERARLEAELQRAHLDALTGVFRREMGRLALRNEIERARRADGKFVIAFIDVDGLKGVNDREGHAAGDRILRTLAATMRANLRSYDPIVRFGGDEFICGISSIDPDEVQHRIGVIDQSLRNATGVGITAGLATLTSNESLDELTAKADAALIEAKRSRGEQ